MKDEYRVKEARAWLEKAEDDLRYASGNLKASFYDLVCYLTQQAAEKALKAYLVLKGVPPKKYKIHLLPKLLEMCEKFNPEFKSLLGESKILDRYYIPTRYPSFPAQIGKFTQDKAQKAIRLASKVINFTKKNIKKEK